MLVYGLLILVIIVMVITSSADFNLTPAKTGTPSERTRSILLFLGKFLRYLGISALFISLGLLVGIIGYHWAAGLSWIDALVEASMILSGMGPISPLTTISAKVFASVYALFSGLIFVIAMGIVLSPLVYSLLSQFPLHLQQAKYHQRELREKDE